MKTFISAILCGVLLFACSPHIESEPTPGSVLIRIEYKHELPVHQSVLYQLRILKAKDIRIDDRGSFLSIQAVWLPATGSFDKLEQAIRDMRIMPGVTYAELEKNNTVVKQSF